MFFSRLRGLFHRGRGRHPQRGRRPDRNHRPQLEALEARCAPAVNWTGLGINNLWSNGNNWDTGIKPQPGASLVFPAGTSQLFSMDDLGNTSFLTLPISGNGYELASPNPTIAVPLTAPSGAISCSGSGNLIEFPVTLASTTGTSIIVNTGDSLALFTPVHGNRLDKEGAGSLQLNGTNDYTGGTFVGGGTLVVGNSLALSTGAVTMAGGTTIQAAGSFPQSVGNELDLNGDVTIAGAAD